MSTHSPREKTSVFWHCYALSLMYLPFSLIGFFLAQMISGVRFVNECNIDFVLQPKQPLDILLCFLCTVSITTFHQGSLGKRAFFRHSSG